MYLTKAISGMLPILIQAVHWSNDTTPSTGPQKINFNENFTNIKLLLHVPLKMCK